MSDVSAISSHDVLDLTTGFRELAAQAAHRGAADAREAATRTWTATQRFVSRLVYTTCYTAAYGLVFPSVLLARSVPPNNAAAKGLIDGVHAARQKAESLFQPNLESSTDLLGPAIARPETTPSLNRYKLFVRTSREPDSC